MSSAVAVLSSPTFMAALLSIDACISLCWDVELPGIHEAGWYQSHSECRWDWCRGGWPCCWLGWHPGIVISFLFTTVFLTLIAFVVNIVHLMSILQYSKLLSLTYNAMQPVASNRCLSLSFSSSYLSLHVEYLYQLHLAYKISVSGFVKRSGSCGLHCVLSTAWHLQACCAIAILAVLLSMFCPCCPLL